MLLWKEGISVRSIQNFKKSEKDVAYGQVIVFLSGLEQSFTVTVDREDTTDNLLYQI